MSDDNKVFDISRPTPTPASRPIITSHAPMADPMVSMNEPAPALAPPPAPAYQTPVPPANPTPEPTSSFVESPIPEAPVPEITHVPVAIAPTQPAAETASQLQPSPVPITPALPGAPAMGDNFPKFGELQPKVEAHPLFSGRKDPVKIKRRWRKLIIPIAALIVIAALGFLFVNSSAGASYLPFHIFKPKATAQSVAAPIKLVTTPVVTTPVSLVPDTYSGWNTNCVKALNACAKYPSDWVANQYNGYENQAQTQYAALSVENVKDTSTADALIVSINDLNTPNPNLKVVGLIVGIRPSYAIYDTNYINANNLKVGDTKNILVGNYTFSGPNGMASLVGTPDTNGYRSITSIDQARAWFVSADAQQVLKVARSFYYQ